MLSHKALLSFLFALKILTYAEYAAVFRGSRA